jgi:hypothetical protein
VKPWGGHFLYEASSSRPTIYGPGLGYTPARYNCEKRAYGLRGVAFTSVSLLSEKAQARTL